MPDSPAVSARLPTVERGFEQSRLADQLVMAAYELVDPPIHRAVPAKPPCVNPDSRDARQGTSRRTTKGACA
jgi:hypothetical protein